MNKETIWKILEDTAYIRTSGSEEEKTCAQYLVERCKEMGAAAKVEPFAVDMADIEEVSVELDGVSLPCKGYRLSGSAEVEAPFLYLPNTNDAAMHEVKGKIVMLDGGGMRHWTYQDLIKYGAVGFLTYDGNRLYADNDIDQKELRAAISQGHKIPGACVQVKDVLPLIKKGVKTAKITIKQREYDTTSQNVVVDLPGEKPEIIVLSAHYDSTPLSKGVYDNMSGSVGIMGVMDYFLTHQHRYSLRFVWCGSEERGLRGSKAYCEAHKEELENVVLNINLDMIGSIMGKFVGCCTAEDKLVHFIEYMAAMEGFGMEARQDVYSSDSTPFADHGVPALSFARLAPGNTATIHNRYDTIDVMSADQMEKDIAFIVSFTEKMANARCIPVGRTIPENMKEKLDIYMNRKRP